MAEGHRYWAFISYSHEDSDFADWLHRSLETYAIPTRLIGRRTPAGTVPRRMRPIFRDRADLAASARLRERVHEALAQSSALIVICSPAAAKSAWVQDEIVRFKSLHGATRVFAVILSGAPGASLDPEEGAEECFPNALRVPARLAGAPQGEHIADIAAADARPEGDGRRLVRLKLVAGVLGLALDDLAQRDAQRRGQRLIALTAASAVGALAMGALALAALASRDEARAQRAQAEGLIEFMLVDLRKKLEPSGRLDVLDAVGTRAMRYYDAQNGHGLDDAGLSRRARVLHLLGEVQDKRGDLDAALKDFQQAQNTTSLLLSLHPTDPAAIFNHAQSLYWVGNIAFERGDKARALEQFERYRRLAEQLVAINPGSDDWWTEVGSANSDLGAVLLQQARVSEARVAFARALEIDLNLARKAPGDRSRRLDLAQSYAWLADAERSGGDVRAALRHRLAERDIYVDLLASAPHDNATLESMMVNRRKIGELLLAQERVTEAVGDLRVAAEEADRLIAVDEANVQYKERAAIAYTALGVALLRQGALAAAAGAADRAESLVKAVIGIDPSQRDWQGGRLGAVRVLRIAVAAQGARDTESCARALAPAAPEAVRLMRLVALEPRDRGLARVAAEAAALSAQYALANGRSADARGLSRAAKSLLDSGPANSMVDGDGKVSNTRDSGVHLRTEIEGPLTLHSICRGGRYELAEILL